MVKSLSSPTVNPAALDAVKPEASASRYTYIKHNMNWTRSVLGAKNMPTHEKAARVVAAIFVALVEFFLVNGAFLFANAGLFIANQAHRAFAKQQISEIELPPSPKSPKGPFTPTVADLPGSTPSDEPSAAGNQSPRAQELAATVADVASDILPGAPLATVVEEDAGSVHEDAPLPAAVNAAVVEEDAASIHEDAPLPAAVNAAVVEDDAVSVHEDAPQPAAVPANMPAAAQDETESVASADQDLLDQAIAASLLPSSPTASENAAAIGLFADLEEVTDAALLAQTLAASQEQQPASADAETLNAALDGFAEDLDDAMLNQGLAASQLPASPSSKASSRSQSPAAALVTEERPAEVVASPSSKASSKPQSPVADADADEWVVVTAPSSKASSRAQSPVAALVTEERPADVVASPFKAPSRAATPVAALVTEERPADVVASPSSKASSKAQSPVAAERVLTPVAAQQKERTPAASPVQMQQAERIPSPILPFFSPAAAHLAVEESDDSGSELGSERAESPAPLFDEEAAYHSPTRSNAGTPTPEFDEEAPYISPTASQAATPRGGSPVQKPAADDDSGSASPDFQAGVELDEVSSQGSSGSEEDYESESDDEGQELVSPTQKPAGMARLWGLFGK